MDKVSKLIAESLNVLNETFYSKSEVDSSPTLRKYLSKKASKLEKSTDMSDRREAQKITNLLNGSETMIMVSEAIQYDNGEEYVEYKKLTPEQQKLYDKKIEQGSNHVQALNYAKHSKLKESAIVDKDLMTLARVRARQVITDLEDAHIVDFSADEIAKTLYDYMKDGYSPQDAENATLKDFRRQYGLDETSSTVAKGPVSLEDTDDISPAYGDNGPAGPADEAKESTAYFNVLKKLAEYGEDDNGMVIDLLQDIQKFISNKGNSKENSGVYDSLLSATDELPTSAATILADYLKDSAYDDLSKQNENLNANIPDTYTNSKDKSTAQVWPDGYYVLFDKEGARVNSAPGMGKPSTLAHLAGLGFDVTKNESKKSKINSLLEHGMDYYTQNYGIGVEASGMSKYAKSQMSANSAGNRNAASLPKDKGDTLIDKLFSDAWKYYDEYTQVVPDGDDIANDMISGYEQVTGLTPDKDIINKIYIKATGHAEGEESTDTLESMSEALLNEMAAGDVRVINERPGVVAVAVASTGSVYEYSALPDTISVFKRMLEHGAGYNALNYIKKYASKVEKITVDSIYNRAVDRGLARVTAGTAIEKKMSEGVIKKVGDSWRIYSAKDGHVWPQHYDSKEKAEAGLKAYHVNH